MSAEIEANGNLRGDDRTSHQVLLQSFLWGSRLSL